VFDILNGIAPDSIQKVLSRKLNGKLAGAVALGTIPSGRVLIPFWAGIALENAAGVTVPASLSIGTDGPSYSDIVAPAPLTGLVLGKYAPISMRQLLPILYPGTQAFVNVTVAATLLPALIRWRS
jgi:hypothetical protein